MTATKQNEILRLGRRFVQHLHNETPLTAMKQGVSKIIVKSLYSFKKWQFKNRTFNLFNQELPYFIHDYNATWRNERCIEIAAAIHFLKQWPKAEFLELGNVMSYYLNHSHYVVDKYEQSPGIHNIDFAQFTPPKIFDGFISVSTLEHIGWDETPREVEKVKCCIEKIRNCVRSTDKVFVTFPLGYNEYLDNLVKREQLPFQKSAFMVRIDENQNWEEVELHQALQPEYSYGHRFPFANACFFGTGLIK